MWMRRRMVTVMTMVIVIVMEMEMVSMAVVLTVHLRIDLLLGTRIPKKMVNHVDRLCHLCRRQRC